MRASVRLLLLLASVSVTACAPTVDLKKGVHDYGFLPTLLVSAGFTLTLFREEELNLETAFMELTRGLVQ